MRRQEIQAPRTALPERRDEMYLGPTRAQVDEAKSPQAVVRFEDDRPRADLARVSPRLRYLPLWRAPAGLSRKHSHRGHRRHRASDKSVVLLGLSSRASFALSRGLPNLGVRMLDPSPRDTSPYTARHERKERDLRYAQRPLERRLPKVAPDSGEHRRVRIATTLPLKHGMRGFLFVTWDVCVVGCPDIRCARRDARAI
jgi:hypothetical protein